MSPRCFPALSFPLPVDMESLLVLGPAQTMALCLPWPPSLSSPLPCPDDWAYVCVTIYISEEDARETFISPLFLTLMNFQVFPAARRGMFMPRPRCPIDLLYHCKGITVHTTAKVCPSVCWMCVHGMLYVCLFGKKKI